MITDNKANYRKSRQRERILAFIRSTKRHPTADWIYDHLKEEMPRLSLGTVYRNLRILEDQGHLIKLPSGSSFDRYDGNTDLHYHIRCAECGRVDDINVPVMSSINEHAEKISGYRSLTHRIDFTGICADCSGRNVEFKKNTCSG